MPAITGTVTTANGIPQPNASIMLLGGGVEPRIALTGINGIYTFNDVSSGRYKLTAVLSHTVTEQMAEIAASQVENTVVDFTILFFRTNKTWYDYLQDNRFVLLKYAQYGFLGYIAYLFFSNLVSDQVGKLGIDHIETAEKARGVITYLISVTTIGMATILMISSIMTGGKEMKERFALGKEILTLLIGILGTIIGFYYGSTNNSSKTTSADSTAALRISPLVITREKNDSMRIIIKGHIEKGTPPYSYLTSTDSKDLFQVNKDRTSTSDDIIDELLLKEKPKIDEPISITISGSDKNKTPFKQVGIYTIRKDS